MVTLLSCKEEIITPPEPDLSESDLKTIAYFKAVALGFESDNASSITRKWNTNLKVFVGGNPTKKLSNELTKIISKINQLATDGFKVKIVNNPLQSNYYIFFGTDAQYVKMYPNSSKLVEPNWGLFTLYWNSNNYFTSGHMYVNIERARSPEQLHLLREELTPSLRLARNSPLYSENIFQSK